MDIATISILIITIGCIIGLAEWIRLTKGDSSTLATQISTLETKVTKKKKKVSELEKDKELIEVTVQKALEEKIINDKQLALILEKLKIQELNPIVEK